MNPKVKRITNDNTRLGPGCYDVSDTLSKKSPRALINFGISKSSRKDTFTKKTTNPSVGPGSYDITKEIDRKIYAPSIPRDMTNKSMITQMGRVKRNKGSIRDNFDVDSDSEEEEDRLKNNSPGPGSYLNDSYINTIG